MKRVIGAICFLTLTVTIAFADLESQIRNSQPTTQPTTQSTTQSSTQASTQKAVSKDMVNRNTPVIFKPITQIFYSLPRELKLSKEKNKWEQFQIYDINNWLKTNVANHEFNTMFVLHDIYVQKLQKSSETFEWNLIGTLPPVKGNYGIPAVIGLRVKTPYDSDIIDEGGIAIQLTEKQARIISKLIDNNKKNYPDKIYYKVNVKGTISSIIASNGRQETLVTKTVVTGHTKAIGMSVPKTEIKKTKTYDDAANFLIEFSNCTLASDTLLAQSTDK